METFWPPEGITSLIWKGDTVLLIARTSSSGEDCIRFFVRAEKEIFECMEYLFLVSQFVVAFLYSSVGYGRVTGFVGSFKVKSEKLNFLLSAVFLVSSKTLYSLAWNS